MHHCQKGIFFSSHLLFLQGNGILPLYLQHCLQISHVTFLKQNFSLFGFCKQCSTVFLNVLLYGTEEIVVLAEF